MKRHTKNWLESRNCKKGDTFICEWQGEGCQYFVMEVHHNMSSYRGERDDDPYNLLGVCRNCHNKLGALANHRHRAIVADRIKFIIDTIKQNGKHPYRDVEPVSLYGDNEDALAYTIRRVNSESNIPTTPTTLKEEGPQVLLKS